MLQDLNPVDVVATARRTFNSGTTRNLHQRKKSLRSLVNFFQEQEDAIIECVFADSRKNREETRLEIYAAISHIQHLIDNVGKWVSGENVRKRWVNTLDKIYVHSKPYGVVLLMPCWNKPILSLLPLAGAIAAGNCVVIKPAHNGHHFGKFLATVLPSYLDPECYPIFCEKNDCVDKLLEEKFDYIYFTGTASVGRIIHRAANKYLTPISLQLGGKNPVYIDSSADLEQAAARIIRGKCFNSGQTCSCPDYVLCSKPITERFVEHAKTAIERFYPDSQHCPIVNDHQLQRLSNLLKGLDIALGGGVDFTQRTMQPTVAVNVSPDHPIMEEEILGPILPIVTVNSTEEAVNCINRREKPLVIYLFSKKSSVKRFFIENTTSEAVTVNDTIVESLPYGGLGSSAMGRFDSFDTNKKIGPDKNTWGIVERVNELRYPRPTKPKTDLAKFLLKNRRRPSWVLVVTSIVVLLALGASFKLDLWS
ncbi:hypothetical protein Zmor_022438 [Zophobas morio]|uniref:Aldehyde dehydrogenase n=2 Tax=Zophobas morio TaxID=2755281 RepID=A0AA38HW33_9CUCU|nr:hypothetical protein Zmor_022438 [Zophobas morio]